MPKLWNQTIEAHRLEVRDAIVESAADLVAEGGVRAVTMSQIAQRAGIGRATLYKYFPDVETILVAWHDRRTAAHLERLAAIRDGAAEPGERVAAVLGSWARIVRETADRHHGTELAGLVHRDRHAAEAHRRLRTLVREVLAEAARCGAVRRDYPADELAGYCLHALDAARDLPEHGSIDGLVDLTLTALRPQ